jgi:hypothetical protein
MLKSRRFFLLTLSAALVAMAQASETRAGMVLTYKTGVGSYNDGSFQGEADITLGTGTITITLQSLIVPGTGSNGGNGGTGQFVSGILLTLGTSSNLTSATFTTDPKATAVNIASDGTFTQTPNTDLTMGSYSWGVTTSGKTVEMGAAGPGSSGQPNGLIIGPTGFDMSGNPIYNTGTYDVANGNLHSPVQGPVTFTLNVPGVTMSTPISSVQIEFGTAPDKTVDANLQPAVVPEPATVAMALSGLGICALAALYRRRQRNEQAVA